jgi:hypothetical protein
MKSKGLRDMAIEWALRSADKNKDKKISFEEYMNDFREAPGPNLAHYGEEFAEQEEQRFQEDLDLNGDGFIAGDELKYWLGPGIGSIGYLFWRKFRHRTKLKKAGTPFQVSLKIMLRFLREINYFEATA